MTKHAIILGGELRNRGAQAMTMRAVSAIKRLMPNIEPILVSPNDAKQPLVNWLRGRRDRQDIGNLAFPIIWGDLSVLADVPTDVSSTSILNAAKRHLMRTTRSVAFAAEIRHFSRILNETALCVDISGFAFGAQWGYENCQRYLTKLEYLHERGIPTYVLPQSFGPFEFASSGQTEALRVRANKILPHPRMLCARERQGLNDIFALCPDARCTLEEDIVLQGGEIDHRDIFVDPSLVPCRPGIETDRNVGIVPNARTFDHGDEARLLALYGSLIEELVRGGYHVYVIRHSEDDEGRCAQLKALFPDDPRVVLMNEERYCFQYGELFERCDFLIASRFHAIVHAYRCGVPCVSLGWATKYVELLGRFGQGRYVHDVRDLDDEAALSVFASVHMMEERFSEEATKITQRMAEIQAKPSVFERMTSDYAETSQC